MIYLFRRLIGWYRLRFGFCPYCDSSPPRETCPVCQGSYHYGHKAEPELRATWRKRYIDLLKTKKRWT